MTFIYFIYLVYFYNNVHKVLCLGGPRYKPQGVSRGSPRLHLIIMFMLMFVCCCCDRNKIQFNSIQFNPLTVRYINVCLWSRRLLSNVFRLRLVSLVITDPGCLER